MSWCVDASLVVKLLVPEPGSEVAREWFGRHAGEELLAPHFLPAEVVSVLRRKSRRGELTPEEAREAVRFLARLQLRLVWDWSLAERALSLAEELDQPTAYDTFYLAVAEAEGCALVTADREFAGRAAALYPFVEPLR